MAWRNLFLPHPQNHQKAHLISIKALFAYLCFFILLQVGFSIIGYVQPGILGVSGTLDQKKLIELTNLERQKMGLSPVAENSALDQAAQLKAQNMFAENYWAHFSPSGKTPWDFILGSGYKFSFAGENLAKNFQSSEEVIKAWMASPTHRDNLLNPRYKDIGMAVSDGVLNGQKTLLVVEEFGTTESFAVHPSVDVSGKQISLSEPDYNNKPQLLAAISNYPSQPALLNPVQISKFAALSIILLMIILLAIDIWVLKKRGVFRVSSHNIAHMALLSLAAGSLLMASPGAII